jgi:hypothetical protein
LSDLALDRLVAGERAFPPPAAQHLGSCSACRARLDELSAEAVNFDRS